MTKTLINRDPFCAVRMSNIEHSGKATDKFLVELENENGALEPLPGVNAVHSADYVLVPNQQVYDIVGDVLTRTGYEFKPIPSFGGGHSDPLYWDCKRFSAKWYTDSITAPVKENTIALGVEAVNSYDGSQPVGIRFFAMHCLCSNQFFITNLLGNFVFRHMSRDAGINLMDNVTDTLAMLRQQASRFIDVAPMFKRLAEKGVENLQGFLKFRQQANKDFWKSSRDPDVLDELYGNGVTQELGIPQLGGDPHSYWNILNAYTAVSTHRVGGPNGANLSDRITQFTMNHAGIKKLAA